MRLVAATLVSAATAGRIAVTSHEATISKHNFTDADFEWHGTGSPFEEWSASLDTPDCPSRVRRSTCSNDQYRGIVVFFHGYSACSEQVESVSESLADNCVDVLAPTMPGHGNAAIWCGEGGASCDVSTHNGMGWTFDNLPSHRRPYDDFATEAYRTLRQELNHRVSVTGRSREDVDVSLIGLSFGAPMALKLAMMGGARHYPRMLLVNPYLALGDESIDQAKMDCENDPSKTSEQCEEEAVTAWLAPAGLEAGSAIANYLGSDTETVVRSLFCNLAKLSDAVGDSYQGRQEATDEPSAIAGIMELEQEWGAVCNQIWTEGRGGFCKFRNKHYLATHSVGLHAIVDAQRWGAWSWGVPKTQIITTERDGKTRNGLTYELAQVLHWEDSESVSMCMHKFQEGTDRSDAGQFWSDENSMPHANLKGTRAAGRWWEPQLFDKVKRFILGDPNPINEPVQLSKDRNVCEAMDLAHRAERTPEVLALVDIGVAPTSPSELWPGLLYNTLSLTGR